MSSPLQPSNDSEVSILQQIHELQQQQTQLDQELEASLTRTANLEFSLEFLLHNNTQVLNQVHKSPQSLSDPANSQKTLQTLQNSPHFSNLPAHYSFDHFQRQAATLRSDLIDSSRQLAQYIQDLDHAQTVSSQTLSRVDHIISLVSLNHELDAYSDHVLGLNYAQLLQFQGDFSQYPESTTPLNLTAPQRFLTLLNKTTQLQDVIFDSILTGRNRISGKASKELKTTSNSFFRQTYGLNGQNGGSLIIPSTITSIQGENQAVPLSSHLTFSILHADKVLHLYLSKSTPLLKLHLLRNYFTILSTIHQQATSQSNQSPSKYPSLVLTSIPKDVLQTLYSISTSFLKIKSPHLALILYTNLVLITLQNAIYQNDLHYSTIPDAAQVSYLDLVSHITTLTTNTIQSQLKPIKSIFGFAGLIYLIHVLTEYTYSILSPLLYRMLVNWQLDVISPTLANSLPLLRNAQSSLDSLVKSRAARSNNKQSNTPGQTKIVSTINPQNYDISKIAISPTFHLPTFVSLSYSSQYPAAQVTQQAQRDYNTMLLQKQHAGAKNKIIQTHSAYKNQSYLSSGFNYLSGFVTSGKEHNAAGNSGVKVDHSSDLQNDLNNEPYPIISPSTLWPDQVTTILKELDDKLEQSTTIHRVLDAFVMFVNDLTSVVIKQFVAQLEKDYITFHQGLCNTWFAKSDNLVEHTLSSNNITNSDAHFDVKTRKAYNSTKNDASGGNFEKNDIYPQIVDKFLDYAQQHLVQSTAPPQSNQPTMPLHHQAIPKLFQIFKPNQTQPVKVDRLINLLDATITKTPNTAVIPQPDVEVNLTHHLASTSLFQTTMYSFLNLINPASTNLIQYYIQHSPSIAIPMPLSNSTSNTITNTATNSFNPYTSLPTDHNSIPSHTHNTISQSTQHSNIHLLNYLHHTSPILYSTDLHLINAIFPSLHLASLNIHHSASTSPSALQIASTYIEHLTQILSYYNPYTTQPITSTVPQINPFLNTFFTPPSCLKTSSKSSQNSTTNTQQQLVERTLILPTHSLREFLQELMNIYMLFEQSFLSTNITKACVINNAFKGSVGFEFYLPQLSRISLTQTTLARSMFLNCFTASKQHAGMVSGNTKVALYTDDSFYLLMKCIKRALYSSSIDSVLALINISLTFLQDKICLYAVSQLLPFLQTIAMQGRYTKELLADISSLHQNVSDFSTNLSSTPSPPSSSSNSTPTNNDSSQNLDYTTLLIKRFNTGLQTHVTQQGQFQHNLMEILLACDGRTGLLIDHSFQEILTKNYKDNVAKDKDATKDGKDVNFSLESPHSSQTHPAGIQPALYYTLGNIYTIADTFPNVILQQLYLFYTEISFLYAINNIDHLATHCINLHTYLVQLFDDYFGAENDEDDLDEPDHPQDTAHHPPNPLLTQYNSITYQQTQRKSLFNTISQLFDISAQFSKFVKLAIQVHINRLIIRLKSKLDGFLVHDYSITDLATLQPPSSSTTAPTSPHGNQSSTTPLPPGSDDSILSSMTSNLFRSLVDNQLTDTISSTSSALLSFAAMGLSTTSCTTGQQVSNWVLEIFLIIQQELKVYLPCFTPKPLTWYLLAVVQYLTTRLYRLLIGNQTNVINQYFTTQLGSTLSKTLKKEARQQAQNQGKKSLSPPTSFDATTVDDAKQRITINAATNMITIDQAKAIPMFPAPRSHQTHVGNLPPHQTGQAALAMTRDSETDLTFTLLGGLQFDTDLRWLLSALLTLISSDSSCSSNTTSTHQSGSNTKSMQSLDQYLDANTINTLTLHVKEKFAKLLQASYVLQSSTLYEVDMMVEMELNTSRRGTGGGAIHADLPHENQGEERDHENDDLQTTTPPDQKKDQIDAVLQWFLQNNTNDEDNNSNAPNELSNSNWKLNAREMYTIATLRCDFTPNDWAMLQERLVGQFVFQP